MTNYLGRCKEKGCDYALFATGEDVHEAANAVAGGPAVRVGNNVMGRCANSHKWFVLKSVQGTFSEVHECDSRCLNAKGPDCTCSCGGANHGRGHAVVIAHVEPSAERQAQVEADRDLYAERVTTSFVKGNANRDHIGEIGAFIRGSGTVTKLGHGVNEYGAAHRHKLPYLFETPAGNIIAWWRPEFIDDPEFKLGQKVTFRAKVKAHNTYNNVAQTVVTHLEEVE